VQPLEVVWLGPQLSSVAHMAAPRAAQDSNKPGDLRCLDAKVQRDGMRSSPCRKVSDCNKEIIISQIPKQDSEGSAGIIVLSVSGSSVDALLASSLKRRDKRTYIRIH
jgi:hypothetical protein